VAINAIPIMVRPIDPGSGTVVVVPVKLIVAENVSSTDPLLARFAKTV